MPIALDATYSLDPNPSGVSAYSREIMFGLSRAHPQEHFLYCYRPHRVLRSFRDTLPANASRRLLAGAPPGDVFHALNQRVDASARRTVTTFHDLFVMTGDYSSPDFRARFTEHARGAVKRSDLIIAVSQFTAVQVEQLLGVPASRIRVIHHGVRAPVARSGGRENIILFVGAIQRRKNVRRLIKAFERMKPCEGWRLALAGAPAGYGGAEELEAVEESPRRSEIDVLGYVSSARLEDLLQRARIFAFPSLDEGFGMPVLEAMAHGIPVITSNRSALPEVAGEAALLVDPEDNEALSDALSRLTADDELRTDLIRRGLERTRQFTWDAAVEKTWAVYGELR